MKKLIVMLMLVGTVGFAAITAGCTSSNANNKTATGETNNAQDTTDEDKNNTGDDSQDTQDTTEETQQTEEETQDETEEVLESVIDYKVALALFQACTGFEGSSGSSLKEAMAAATVAEFAADYNTADIDMAVLVNDLSAGYEKLSDESKEEFANNFIPISNLVEAAIEDYEANSMDFVDAGVDEQMQDALSDEEISQDFAFLKSAIKAVMDNYESEETAE